jgi:hypothetical protein
VKKMIFAAIIFLSAALLMAPDSIAEGDIELQCCCQVTCCYSYNTYTDPFTMREWCLPTPPKPACTPANNILALGLCETDIAPNWDCIEFRVIAQDSLKASFEDLWLLSFDHYTGGCELTAATDCVADSLLGADDQGLDILRQFRDQVLGKSAKGQKYASAYYKYGSDIKQALNNNPGLKNFTADLLGKVIVRLFAALGSKEELLTDDIAGDIEIFADALDAEVTQPEFKQVIQQVKTEARDRTLFK